MSEWLLMVAVRPEQVTKILELTDSLNLHREAVVIPLQARNGGGVAVLSDQRLQITVPSNRAFDEWIVELRGKLASMDLSTIRH